MTQNPVELLAMLAGKQVAKAATEREQNRAWVSAHMPEFAALFDQLRDFAPPEGDPKFSPRMVRLEKFA